jgi:hypothetical protein
MCTWLLDVQLEVLRLVVEVLRLALVLQLRKRDDVVAVRVQGEEVDLTCNEHYRHHLEAPLEGQPGRELLGAGPGACHAHLRLRGAVLRQLGPELIEEVQRVVPLLLQEGVVDLLLAVVAARGGGLAESARLLPAACRAAILVAGVAARGGRRAESARLLPAACAAIHGVCPAAHANQRGGKPSGRRAQRRQVKTSLHLLVLAPITNS